MKKGLLVLAAALGLAIGFVLGALRAAGDGVPGRPSSYVSPVLRQGAEQAAEQALLAAALDGRDPADVADHHVVFGDVIPGAGHEAIVGLALVSGDGLVTVFERAGAAWRRRAGIDGFAAIDGLAVMDLAGEGSGELLVYDDHDELVGAFYRRRALTIWKWRDGRFVNVWSETLYEELYSLEPPLAEQAITAVDVQFHGPELRVRGLVTRSRRRSDGTYEEVERVPVDTRWRWDPDRFRFVRADARGERRSASQRGGAV